MSLEKELLQFKEEFIKELNHISLIEDIEKVKTDFLGKKGKLTFILKGLGGLSPEDRSSIGSIANQIKEEIQNLLTQKETDLKNESFKKLKDTEWFDMTISPPTFPNKYYLYNTSSKIERGHIHPISLMQKKLEDIFTSMGFSILDGPQVEFDFFNFEALNFSEDHPAREMQDTFYLKDKALLRTHTSSIQIRGMLSNNPPLKIIAPGRVFRYEEVDASHEHTFYQMEGMIIDKNVSVSNLLYLMETLLEEVFNKKVEVRLRPGYFPFVEPGFELDMKCLLCNGDGCSVCKRSGWVEVLPCGLVHPNVIKSAGLNPDEWQGAAFGLGLNRLVMMKYGIEDIRYFQGSNLEFLRQF